MRLLLLSFVLLTSGISFKGCDKKNIDLDNAGAEPLRVQIDGMTYTMPAGSYQRLELAQGPHTIVVSDLTGKSLDEESFQVIAGGLLNVAKEEYFVWTDLYGDPALRDTKLQEIDLEIGDAILHGDFKSIPQDQIYVEQVWDLNLSESFPKELVGWEQSKDKYLVKSKVFRRAQLLEAFNAVSAQ